MDTKERQVEPFWDHFTTEDGTDVRRGSYRNRYTDSDGSSLARHRISRDAAADDRGREAPVDDPSVTVILPSHNEEETIAATVRACLAQDYPIESIIVIADSCEDGTADAARSAGATLVLETNYKDKASNQNEALKYVTSDVIVGFDGDTIPQPGCIRIMLDDIKAGCDATCSTILPLQSSGFFVYGRRFAYSLGRRWWRLCQAKVGRMQVMTGASYAFRTDVIREIGGFPNGLISADMDVTWALHRDHYKCGYAATALALTVEPETWHVYRGQMRRWSSGYFQNLARYKRQVFTPRSALVIWTAMFDLLSLFLYETVLMLAVVTGHEWMARTFAIGMGVHAVITTALVATVVGPKQAIIGYFPYLILNYYNKWLYMCALTREWILGRHYTAWTGRQATKTVITSMTARRKLVLTTLAALVVIGVGAGMIVDGGTDSGPVIRVATAPTATRIQYIGAVTKSPSTALLDDFGSKTGTKPNLDEYYVPWGQPFNTATADDLWSDGAMPLVSWEPFTRRTVLTWIADGRQDGYITSWAKAVAALHRPIAISFAAEMNGYWEDWGTKHNTPAQFVAAWRHVHDVFIKNGATNVLWVWSPNIVNHLNVPLAPYWPGSAYVDWVGMDGYWRGPSSSAGTTFNSVFGPTVTEVRKFSSKPMLIAETAGVPGWKVRAINDLFYGVEHTKGMIGFVWFNENARDADWRVTNDPSSLATFKADAHIKTPGETR